MTLTNSHRRILLVVENVPLSRDHRLRKQARALRDAGFDVSVVCPRDPGNAAVSGITVHDYQPAKQFGGRLGYLWEYGYSWLMAALLIAKVWRHKPFDAIQVSGTPDIYFTLATRYQRRGRPLVVDQRDLSPELYERRYHRRDRMHRILLRLERRSYRSADHVLTVNASLRQIVRDRGGLPASAVTIVGNGPDLADVSRCQPDPELRHGRSALACWVGLLGPQDEVPLALAAIAHLLAKTARLDCHFAFIGDGESRAECVALAEQLGISEYVSFPGWLEQRHAYAYLATADLGLEPNLEPTVTPVKGMEYMLFELPFVAFDLPETRRLAGQAASLVPPGDVCGFADAIAELLASPELRRRRGAVGRRRIEQHFAWDVQQGPYVDRYRRLLGTCRPASEKLSPAREPELAGTK